MREEVEGGGGVETEREKELEEQRKLLVPVFPLVLFPMMILLKEFPSGPLSVHVGLYCLEVPSRN